MDFRILGPLEVSHDGQVFSPGGPRQQTVLAMLLLAANRAMTVDRLATALWEGAPPPTARSQVQMCISGLRRQLGPAADGQQRIVGSRAGYALSTNGDRLDAAEFGSQAAAARRALAAQDLLSARRIFRSALELWRGPALAGIDSRLVQQGAAMLDERRLMVTEECLACELGLGLYRDALAELTVLVTDYPLRERFHALLMLALYGAERQAEALAAYRSARETLVEELGIEPGTALQQVHAAILGGIPVRELLGPVGQPMTATVADGSPRTGAPAEHAPRLLIADIPDFTGRSGIVQLLVADITAAANDAAADHAPVPVNVIIGRGGVGKTTLAVHVAHKVAAQFPDGQLFARLRINDRPVDPADILERFLHAIGPSGSVLPDDVEKRADLYRDKLAGRRVLIVLDDVMSEHQITTLLPGSALCSVIITSRRRLTGIAAMSRLELGTFSHGSASKLVASIAGPKRIEAETAAVTALCTLCDYLPLALRIVGSRLAARPHWTVADLVDRLADESRRLDELNHGNMGMRASIALTHDSLSAGARALFRRLALFDAPSFGYWAGAPLLDTTVEAGQDFMDELTDAYLIDAEPQPGGATRYRFHDIMRLFARERLAMDDSAQERHAALERLLGSMLHLAVEAHQRQYPGDFPLLHGGGSRWALPGWLVDRILETPLEWYEHERPSIVAAVRQAVGSGMTEIAWELALSSVALFESHSHFTDWRETHELALEACCKSGDQRGEAAMRCSLGSLHMLRHRLEQAASELASAGGLFEQLGDRCGVALVQRHQAYLDRIDLQNRRASPQLYRHPGGLHLRRGGLDAAAALEEVRSAVHKSDDQVGECYALLGLGEAHARRNDLRAAAGLLTAAESIARNLGERMLLGQVGLARAEVLLRQGQPGAAAEYTDQAIDDFDYVQAHLLKARALVIRDEIRVASGNPRAARETSATAAASAQPHGGSMARK